MIPVVIAPGYNRFDLMQRMIESLDVPVDRLLVIDNARTRDLELMTFVFGSPAANSQILIPPFSSLGYGGSINFGVRQTADAPWWLWTSNDVQFLPGHLETVVERMEAATGPLIITGACTWGAVNREAWDLVGEWDEWSFFPIYFDDNDWHWRARHAKTPVEWVEDQGTIHGEEGRRHLVTIAQDPVAQAGNSRSFRENQRRYLEKWGGGPGHEVFTTPWNSGAPVWVLKPDIDGRRDRQW